MSFWGRFSLSALAAMVLLAVNGCSPVDQGQLDEEKEPHYVLGKSRVNAMDYTGALDAFRESLEVNPRSAAAHFQLACLFDTKQSDPAAAVYHYQEYLRLNPKAENAEVINQRIYSCKQQLAADVLPLPSAPAAQQQLEKLAEQNRRMQDELDKWRAYYAAQSAALKTNVVPLQNSYAPTSQPTSLTPDDVTAAAATTIATGGPTVAPARTSAIKVVRTRTHVVAAGETLAAIARKHAISLYALEAANPGINPRKLKAGQVLNLPPP